MDDSRSGAGAPDRLRGEQYFDARNLDARIALHARFSVARPGFHRWLFDQIALAPDAEVLELGCGPAALWCENADRIPPGWRIRLSDFSPGMLDDARARVAAIEHPFELEVIDAMRIPHAKARFDGVLANHMLYHVDDRPAALAEIARVLRPGGLLVASTLSEDTFLEVGELVRRVTARRDFVPMRMAGHFSLANGEAQLAPFFARVERRIFEDALVITEAQPLVAYLRSMILDTPFSDEELAAIGRGVEEAIRRDGAFHVRKSAGVFLART